MRNRLPCAVLALVAVSFAAPCTPKNDHRKIDQAAIQNIQKNQVNSGKEYWRTDARQVAQHEAASLDPALKGAFANASVKPVKGDDRVQIFSYTTVTNDKSYEITMKKPEWLLPYAGIYKMMMWVVTDVKTVCPAGGKH